MIECPRCKTEIEPDGTSEDAREWTCETCGFVFLVEIEYEPIYSESCVNHEFGDWETRDPTFTYRSCKWCGKHEIIRQEHVDG